MLLLAINCVVFACFISLGQSVSPPFPFDCIPTFKACEGKTDCPKSYPLCSAGRCCRRPIFPPLCPGGIRGPKCGRLDDPPCKPGYTCRLGYCCRDVVVPPRCPSGHISGPLCPPSRCPAAFTCMKGRCCRKRIITPRCPKEMLYTGRCRAGRCRVGSCINGACCLKMAPLCPLLRRGPQCGPKDPPCKQGYTCTGGYCCRDEVTPPQCPAGHISGPLCPPSRCPAAFTCVKGRCCRKRIITPRCPKEMLYTGRCLAGRCRVGSCINGACCLKMAPLPLCPLLRRGPQCGPKDPPCKPGYTCTGGYCCRDEVTPPQCPAGHISGPLCPPSRCLPGFTCMNGRCCRRRIITPRCPKGMLYTGRCRAGRCRFGSCINGACCRKINPLPKCPRPFVYTGRCINGKCRIGNCMKGACCRGPIIKPPPFGRCPPPPKFCPAVEQPPPTCESHTDCSKGEKCCSIGCRPAECVPDFTFPPQLP